MKPGKGPRENLINPHPVLPSFLPLGASEAPGELVKITSARPPPPPPFPTGESRKLAFLNRCPGEVDAAEVWSHRENRGPD